MSRFDVANAGAGKPFRLRYFDQTLAYEYEALKERRKHRPEGLRRSAVARNVSHAAEGAKAAEAPSQRIKSDRTRSPDPEDLFRDDGKARPLDEALEKLTFIADPGAPDPARQRPTPIACDATGLALSGGGVRSAATCLGVLQALHATGRLRSFDYLSTVSGGGYIGASLSAYVAHTVKDDFPFGADVADSPAVAHLRDYSNYLLPRGRGLLHNGPDVAAVLLRGFVTNVLIVAATILFAAIATVLAFPTFKSLAVGGYASGVVVRLASLFGLDLDFAFPFGPTLLAGAALGIGLVLWALARSTSRRGLTWSDTDSRALKAGSFGVLVVAILAFLDLQPIAIDALAHGLANGAAPNADGWLVGVMQTGFASIAKVWGSLSAAMAAFAAVTSFLGGPLGQFLRATESTASYKTIALRVAIKCVVALASIVLPLLLWFAYLFTTAAIIRSGPAGGEVAFPASLSLVVALCLFVVFAAVTWPLNANAFSLHRLYRDRLSRAFIFMRSHDPREEVVGADSTQMSHLQRSRGPYPIVNAALNVEGSKEANKRGREADFFTFTPHFIGSDLTLYAPTAPLPGDGKGMEQIDRALNLATAMAISGAAVSANMGASTVRLLSPTLALLNVRLGYWLRNPRDLVTAGEDAGGFWSWNRLRDQFYLLAEMLNLLDETSRKIYLTDGGHVENLGVYELLKRGCKLILVVDAEADPLMTFGAFMRLERYARIDLGVRIDLPWQAIAQRTEKVGAAIERARVDSTPIPQEAAPHCAVGRICYADGALGLLLYFKASLTGDEKDYVVDYKARNPSFPHETTLDQFFSEEQFEVYRALGFHMVQRFFTDREGFEFVAEKKGDGEMTSCRDVFAEIDAALPQEQQHAQ